MTKTQKSAGAVIFREGSDGRVFLLLHYPTGHWDFVKGKIEEGESPHETLIRETREETGIQDIEIIEGMGKEIYYEFMHNGELIHKSVVFFLAKTETSNIQISHEHKAYSWEPFDGAMQMLTYDNARDVLVEALRVLGD